MQLCFWFCARGVSKPATRTRAVIRCFLNLPRSIQLVPLLQRSPPSFRLVIAISVSHYRFGSGGIVSKPINEINEVEPSNSILFLGSGFSLGAKNIAGGNPPNGTGLRRHFIRELGLPLDTSYDLQVLTEEFASDDSQKLRDELYRIFRITSLDCAQAAILDEPWRRIYTTNYDDSIEIHRLGKKLPRNDFDVSQAVPNKLPHGA